MASKPPPTTSIARVVLVDQTRNSGFPCHTFYVTVHGVRYTETDVVAALMAVRHKGGWQKALAGEMAVRLRIQAAFKELQDLTTRCKEDIRHVI